MLRRFKGQSTLEYAMIIAVVVGALVAMRFYIGRSMQGKLRESIDSVGGQYSAGNVASKYTIEQTAELKTTETFGLSPEDVDAEKPEKTFQQGVSYRKIITPEAEIPEVKRSAQGEDAEKITKPLAGKGAETLFP